MEASPGSSARSPASDEARVDVRRYLGAIQRSSRMILLIVVVLTGVVLAASLSLPKSYRATATIVLNVSSGILDQPDSETTQRRLATIEVLLTGRETLDGVAEELGDPPGTDYAVQSQVDPAANLVYISASDGDPERAAAIANSAAGVFLDVQRELQQVQLRQAEARLEQALRSVENDPTATDQANAIRDQLNQIGVQRSLAGSDLQLAESAEVPTAPASPRPLRNGVLAFFAALFIGVLLALARDQLRPRISSPRELSRMIGVPVLAGVPYLRRRLTRTRGLVSAVEHEAYQSVTAAVQIQCPPDRQQAILVTSAVHAEGKTTVSARLGRALADAGHDTLLISADLRWPGLHSVFDLPLAPGLADVLGLVERAGINRQLLPATVHTVAVTGGGRAGAGRLDVLTSGRKPPDPARLLASDAMRELREHIRALDYSYVIVDAPPMLGLADVQPLMRLVDRTLLVARLDRITVEHVVDTQELLGRLAAVPLGMVVIGARAEVSPYYLGERPEPVVTAVPAAGGDE